MPQTPGKNLVVRSCLFGGKQRSDSMQHKIKVKIQLLKPVFLVGVIGLSQDAFGMGSAAPALPRTMAAMQGGQ